MTLAARAAHMCFYILNREVFTMNSPERIQNLILINLQEVIEREREACANLANDIELFTPDNLTFRAAAKLISDAIRERGSHL